MTEPEEIIEAQLMAALVAGNVGVPVEGMLTPAAPGAEKLSAPTRIVVAVDLASQDLDWEGPGVPCAWSARVAVRYSAPDDSSGINFRAVCRAVRATLRTYLGDACTALNGGGFNCDAFLLGATSTTFEDDGAGGAFVKIYPVTLNGRFIPPTTEEAQ